MVIVKSLCFQIAYSIIAKTAADRMVGGCAICVMLGAKCVFSKVVCE